MGDEEPNRRKGKCVMQEIEQLMAIEMGQLP